MEVINMKVFIGGARQLHSLNKMVVDKLNSILAKNYDVLIGDANGIDASVQKYYFEKDYKNITVYASNGKARNNVGNWRIENVPVEKNTTGFDFYAAKDLRMAHDADCGFMIWNGKSRGTWNNVVNLCDQNKTVVIYISVSKKIHKVSDAKSAAELKEYIEHFPAADLFPKEHEKDQLRLF